MTHEAVVGVVIIGRLVARNLGHDFTAEVTRLCTDGSRSAEHVAVGKRGHRPAPWPGRASDRGSSCAATIRSMLARSGILVSMSATGDCFDDAVPRASSRR